MQPQKLSATRPGRAIAAGAVAISLFSLVLLAGCDAAQELTDPKQFPQESLPAFLTAEDFSEILLQSAAVLPCPDGVAAAVTFAAPNEAFGLTVAYEAGQRATVETLSEAGVDTVVALFGPDDGSGYYGALPIAVDDDGGSDGRLSRLVETIDVSGRYFAVVTTAGGAGRGAVTLLVGADNCESAPECSADDECDDADPCTTDVCDAATGTCRYVPVPDPGCAACADDSDCAGGDACFRSVCIDGLCIDEASPDGTTCDDGDVCTGGDACRQGACVGTPLACDDGDACTDDFCDPAIGACEHVPLPDPGCGVPGCTEDADCDDGDECTADMCDATTATCQNLAVPGCGAPECTVDSDCDDGDACTADMCDATTATCQNLAVPGCGAPCAAHADCDDGNECTVDTCVAAECEHELAPGCGSQCSTDADCFDANPCTVDTCQAGGCFFDLVVDGAACDDGDPCTTNDACTAGVCAGAPLNCDDGNACTLDSCDSATGTCVHVNDPACG